MTSAKAFACAMCGAPATMTCGGCTGFAYCAEACLRSHWASGHAEACARVARDVAATAAVRAAHDVDALACSQALVRAGSGRTLALILTRILTLTLTLTLALTPTLTLALTLALSRRSRSR